MNFIAQYLTTKVAEIIIAILLGIIATIGIAYMFESIKLARAEVKLSRAQVDIASLKSAINEQNSKVDELGKAKDAAEARGVEAMKVAESNNARLGAILNAVKDIKATTCAKAMPTVDKILEGVLK